MLAFGPHFRKQSILGHDVDELGLKFLISFDCIDRMKNNAQKDAVMMQVHDTLSHSGITMSAGRMYTKLNSDAGLTALNTVRKVDDFEPVKTSKFNPYNESIKNRVLLSRIPIFMSLNNEEIENLSNELSQLLRDNNISFLWWA